MDPEPLKVVISVSADKCIKISSYIILYYHSLWSYEQKKLKLLTVTDTVRRYAGYVYRPPGMSCTWWTMDEVDAKSKHYGRREVWSKMWATRSLTQGEGPAREEVQVVENLSWDGCLRFLMLKRRLEMWWGWTRQTWRFWPRTQEESVQIWRWYQRFEHYIACK